MLTAHGLMTTADLADHERLTDTGRNPDCPGHSDDDAWNGTIYCSRAEICPDEELDPL